MQSLADPFQLQSIGLIVLSIVAERDGKDTAAVSVLPPA
jgi:hypothetical protein